MRMMSSEGGSSSQAGDSDGNVSNIKVKLPDGASYATGQSVWMGGSLHHLGSAILPPGQSLPLFDYNKPSKDSETHKRLDAAQVSPAAAARRVASARACAVALQQPSGHGAGLPWVGPDEAAVWERASMSINVRIIENGQETATMEEMAICQSAHFLITSLPLSTINAVVGPAIQIRDRFLMCSPLVETGIPDFFANLENNLATSGVSSGVSNVQAWACRCG